MKKLVVLASMIAILIAVVGLTSCATAPKATPKPAAAPQETQPIKLVLVSDLARGHTLGVINTETFIDRVQKMSEGKITIDYQDAGRLVTFKDMLPAAQKGIADIFYVVPSFSAGEIPVFAAWQGPFIGNSVSDMTDLAWGLATEQPDLVAGLAKWKLKPLFVLSNDETLFHSRKPINRLEDVKGMRFRTSGGLYDKALAVLQAEPIAIPGSETYVALQRGVVEAVLMHSSSLWGWKWYEQLKYHIVMEPAFSIYPILFGINTDRWDKLPKWAQDILWKASQEHMKTTAPQFETLSRDFQQKLAAYGNNVVKMDPKEVQRFREKILPVTEQWAKENGEPGLRTWEFIKKKLNLK